MLCDFLCYAVSCLFSYTYERRGQIKFWVLANFFTLLQQRVLPDIPFTMFTEKLEMEEWQDMNWITSDNSF